MEERLLEYDSALIIISHDEDALDQQCNKIIEIENAKIKTYNGIATAAVTGMGLNLLLSIKN